MYRRSPYLAPMRRFNPLVVGAIYEIYPGPVARWRAAPVSIPLWSGQYMKFDLHLDNPDTMTTRFNPLVVGAIYEIAAPAQLIEYAEYVSIPLWSGQYMKYIALKD